MEIDLNKILDRIRLGFFTSIMILTVIGGGLVILAAIVKFLILLTEEWVWSIPAILVLIIIVYFIGKVLEV